MMSRWEKVGGRKGESLCQIVNPQSAQTIICCGRLWSIRTDSTFSSPSRQSVICKVKSTQVTFIKNRTESDCENYL